MPPRSLVRSARRRGTGEFRERRDRLADLLSDGTLDRATYQRQRGKLDQELALAERALQDTVVERLGVECILGFAEGVLTYASRVWERATGPQRHPLQALLFPAGVTYEPPRVLRHRRLATDAVDSTNEAFASLRTAVTCAARWRRINDGSATGIRTPVR